MNRVLFVLGVLFFFFLPFGQHLKAQESSRSFHPIISEGLFMSEDIESNYAGVEIVLMEFFKSDNDETTILSLKEGENYVLSCFGVPGTPQINVTIFQIEDDGEMTEYTSLFEYNNSVQTLFSPNKTGRYAVKVGMGDKEGGRFGIILSVKK